MSFSQLQRQAACPASEALPHADEVSTYATKGSVIHQYLEDCVNLGPEEALERVPDEQQEGCASIPLEALPACEPGAYAAEVALAYNPVTDEGRELGRGLDRDYSGVTDGEDYGTIDVVGLAADGETVVVYDYKTGFGDVPPADRNWQLKAAAIAAARAYGRSRASVAIIRVRDDGWPPYFDRATFDEIDMDRIRAGLVEVREAVAAAKSSSETEVTIGEHCRYCPAFRFCPGQRATIAAFGFSELAAELTPEDVAASWHRIKMAEKLIAKAKKAAQEVARRYPVEIGEGRMLGLKEKNTTRLDGGKTLVALRKLKGDKFADACCTIETTKGAIEKALGEEAIARKEKGEKITKKALVSKMLSELEKAGALRKGKREEVTEFNAPKVLVEPSRDETWTPDDELHPFSEDGVQG